jgi:hypothetical protein
MKKMVIGMMVFCSLMALSVAAWCGDNGNGTITVNGLVVLKDAGCLGYMNWDNATARAKTLASGQCGLIDNSKPGDWRLPTLDELKAMYAAKSQFKGVQASYYWSSSTWSSNTYDVTAWYMYMSYGGVGHGYKSYNGYVLAVRAGQ